MRSLIELLFGVAPISVSDELATLINAKRVFIEQKRREDAGLLDEARVIKNRIAFNATEIASAEREIEALERAKAFLAGPVKTPIPEPSAEAMAVAEDEIAAAIEAVTLEIDDYNAADDAKKSYEVAVEAKRLRGDTHWPGPKRPAKRRSRKPDLVTAEA